MVAYWVSHGRTDPGKGCEVNHSVKNPVREMVLADVALAELHPIRQRELRLENVEGSDPVACCVELNEPLRGPHGRRVLVRRA